MNNVGIPINHMLAFGKKLIAHLSQTINILIYEDK